MSKSNYISSLVIAGALLGCQDEVNSARPAEDVNRKPYLISADSITSLPVSVLQNFARMAGQPAMKALVKHGVTTYKLIYETTYQGKPVQASGLLYIPEGLTTAAPLVSLQHGTSFSKSEAPSLSGDYTGMEYFASAGYVAVMPDYIGYGSSSHVFHPYYDREHSSLAVIDLIKSAREFLSEREIKLNNQLFLAGYSEGGYVTLAAANELENNAAHGLTVTAVAAGAGGYDLEAMLESVTRSNYYSYPGYLAFVIMSYNETYNWKKPLTYFFQEKYARALKTHMNGEYSGWQINNRLTTHLDELLDPKFLAGLKSVTGEKEFKEALRFNSVGGWESSLPIRLYHGTKDEIIPYQNSEKTLAAFNSAGSPDVKLSIITGGSHGSSFIPMLQQFVPWFQTLRK